jgi:asparagine synthase (glutamine-hydrolysing)
MTKKEEMCGIWFYLGHSNEVLDNHNLSIRRLTARGPEGMRRMDISGVGVMGFTRLAINGLNPLGMQPMTNGRLWWVCNGEIYNWRALAQKYNIACVSGSDCEVLGHLFQKLVLDEGGSIGAFFRLLDGVFALVIADSHTGKVYVARDPYVYGV